MALSIDILAWALGNGSLWFYHSRLEQQVKYGSGDTLSPFHQRLVAEHSAAAHRLLPQYESQAAWQQGHAWTQAQAGEEAERWLEGDGIG